jgi:hypothetical protein
MAKILTSIHLQNYNHSFHNYFMQSYRFSYPVQRKIYQRLDALVGKGAAAFYRDACYLMKMDDPLESTAHLVGHLLREIESSLRDVLEPLSAPDVSDLNQKSIKCPECKHKFNYAKPNPSHKDEIHAILKALEINPEGEIAESRLKLAGNKNKYGLHSRAHRQDLAAPGVIDNEYKDFWREIQIILDTLLDRFEARAVEIREKLDELTLKPEGTKQDIDFLRLNIPNSAFALGYFFDQLESSDWLEPLNNAGFFDTPPGIEVDVETKGFRFPIWAQSRYLIKVAPKEPKIVLKIAIKLLETGCKNIRIYEDLAEAALKMPSNFAACWVKKAIMWLREQSDIGYYLPNILGELIAYLACENEVEMAIELTRELLTVLPSQDSTFLKKPIIRCNEYSYKKIIEEHISVLTEYQPEVVLTIFCELLSCYLGFSRSIGDEQFSEDYSFSWSPTLEGASGNSNEIDSILARAIWNVAKQIAGSDQNKTRNLFQKFQGYRWLIFDRISLHLLRFFPGQVLDLIINRLLDRKRYQWLGLYLEETGLYYSHEHALLLKEQFTNLPIEARHQIFHWFLEDPMDVMEVDAEKREEYSKYWRRDWLSIIKDYLPQEFEQLYNQLVQDLSEAHSLDSRFNTSEDIGWNGSPKSGTELAEMTEGDMNVLFTYLKEWNPSKKSSWQSRNALAWTLAEQVIAPNPQKFVSQIESFKELDLPFKVWLLRGLRKALENQSSEQQSFSWEPVFAFCAWVLENFREIHSRSALDDYSEWDQICDAVVELVAAGFLAKGASNISLTLRYQVWQLLEPLTSDPHVTPGFTLHYQSSNMGSYGDSINTVRGKAMHAVVRYAFWIRQDASGNAKASQNFEDMPEVQRVLEYHLNPQQDPSSAIRAVYGQWFPQLLHLASEWSLQRIDQIFPEELNSQCLFEAAWSGYTINRLNASVFSNLRRKYIHAVEQLPNLNSSSREQSETARASSSHLLHLFWHEVIDLGEPDRLLEDFFDKAPIHIRENFLEQIGSWLLYQNVNVHDKLRQRLQRFLSWHIDQAKNFNSTVEQFSDLKYFGWLFASGKFDDQWSISKLLDVLKLFGTVNDCGEFLKRLENLASIMPQEVIQCLSLIADGNEALEWFISYHSEHHRSILISNPVNQP